MAKNIVITSGKGGVGKTTVTANLGLALANYGERVLLMDIDFGINNPDVVMGLENKVVYDINDVLEGRCRVKQALLQDKRRKNLYIMPLVLNHIKYMIQWLIKIILRNFFTTALKQESSTEIFGFIIKNFNF